MNDFFLTLHIKNFMSYKLRNFVPSCPRILKRKTKSLKCTIFFFSLKAVYDTSSTFPHPTKLVQLKVILFFRSILDLTSFMLPLFFTSYAILIPYMMGSDLIKSNSSFYLLLCFSNCALSMNSCKSCQSWQHIFSIS